MEDARRRGPAWLANWMNAGGAVVTVEDVIWFGVSLCCGIVASILWLGRNGPVEIPPQRDDEPLRKLFEELK